MGEIVRLYNSDGPREKWNQPIWNATAINLLASSSSVTCIKVGAQNATTHGSKAAPSALVVATHHSAEKKVEEC